MSIEKEINRLTLHFKDHEMQTRFIKLQLSQSRHFFRYCFPIALLAIGLSFAIDFFGDGNINLLASKAAMFAFALILMFLCRCFPSLYLYAGSLLNFAFFAAHSVPMERDFDSCMRVFYFGADLFFLSVVIVDPSWIITFLLFLTTSCLFWLRFYDCFLSHYVIILETFATLIIIFVALAFTVHYLKRNLFFQKQLLEESSANWMSFL